MMRVMEAIMKQITKIVRKRKEWKKLIAVMAAVVFFVSVFSPIFTASASGVETGSTQTAAGVETVQESEGSASEDVDPENQEPEEDKQEEKENKEEKGEDNEGEKGEEPVAETAGSDQSDVDHSAEITSDNSEENSPDNTDSENQGNADDEKPSSGEGKKGNSAENSDASTDNHTKDSAGEEAVMPEGNTTQGTTEVSAETEPGRENLITEETELVFSDEKQMYKVYVSFDSSAQFPVGTELSVKEITEENDKEAYSEYFGAALAELQDKYDKNAMISFSDFYDISFMSEGIEVEPKGKVLVRIEYLDAIEIAEKAEVKTIHFVKDEKGKENPKIINSEKFWSEEKLSAVQFTEDQFSVFGIFGAEISDQTVTDNDEEMADDKAAGAMAGGTRAAGDPVARIGSTEYATLAGAFEAAQNGETVTLLIGLNHEDVVVSGKNITLDVNGVSGFSGQYDRGTLTVESGAGLTLTNSTDRAVYFAKEIQNNGSFAYTGKISLTSYLYANSGSTTVLNGESTSRISVSTSELTPPVIEIGENYVRSNYGIQYNNTDITSLLTEEGSMSDVVVFHSNNADAEAINNTLVFANSNYNEYGTFQYDPASGNIVIHKFGEGEKDNFVCKNLQNGKYYTSLQAALDSAANNYPTISILKDIDTTGDIYAPTLNGSCTYLRIDLKGHTVKTNDALRIPEGKELEIWNNTSSPYTDGTIQCNVDNKGELTLSGYTGNINIDGTFYFTDNSNGGTPTNKTTFNVGGMLNGWYMTDLKTPATLGTNYFSYYPEGATVNIWLTDNDELISDLNSTEPIDDIVLFDLSVSSSATVQEKIRAMVSRINFGGWGLEPAEGVSLEPKYDADARKIVLHKNVPDDVVARIGETNYRTLEDAIYAAVDGDTIKIVATSNRVECGYIYAPSGDNKTVTIDLNGHTVYASADHGYMFYVTGTNHLKLINTSGEDAVVKGNHYLLSGADMTCSNVSMDGYLYLVGDNELAFSNTKEEAISISNSIELKNNSNLTVNGKVDFSDKISLLSGSTATLNCQTDRLTIETDRISEQAVATLGTELSVNGIHYNLTNSSDIATLNRTDTTDDYVIFKGGDQEIAGKILLASGVFTNPMLAVVYTDNAGQGDTEGQIVIRKMNAIFLNGQKGNDSYAGTLTRPVKSFAKAMQIYNANPGLYDGIYISGTVDITGNEIWDGGTDGVTIYRNPAEPSDRNHNLYDRYPESGIFYTSNNNYNVPYLVSLSGQNGKLTLKNITIDGNRSIAKSDQSATLISVVQGATLNIEEGAVLQNSDVWNSSSIYGGAVNANKSTVNMSGGAIRNNKASGGGGIYISGSTFNMSGGEITGNTALNTNSRFYSNGGGIFVTSSSNTGSVMNMSGGTISGNEAGYYGGGISVGGYYTATVQGRNLFNMSGGVISDNKSGASGGGMFIQQNCIGTITEGVITDNQCCLKYSSENLFGGGGIYVNGGNIMAGYPDGELHLYNVVITDNTAAIEGGGVAGCPTSHNKSYLGDGGVIYGNSAPSAREVYAAAGVYGNHSGIAHVYLSPFVLGGGVCLWMTEDNEPVNYKTIHSQNPISLHNDLTDEDEAVINARSLAKVWITNNSSTNRGGGLGSNGIIYIGNSEEETVDVSAQKKWSEGTEPTSSIRLMLQRRISIDPEEFETVAYQIITAADDWKFTFENLPKYLDSENQQEIIYRVIEDPDYEVQVEEDGETVNKKCGQLFSITAVYDPQTETWIITNSRYQAKVIIRKTNDAGYQREDTVYLMGAEFELKDGEGITIEGLQASDENGFVTSEDGLTLSLGSSFYLRETRAPEQCVPIIGNITITVSDSPDVTVTVQHETVACDVIKDDETGVFTIYVPNDEMHDPEGIDISVEKIWDDNADADHIRPEIITFHLFANGNELEDQIKTVPVSDEYLMVNAPNGVSIYHYPDLWQNMPTCDENENPIEYTVTEESVDGYTSVLVNTQLDTMTWTFKNIHTTEFPMTGGMGTTLIYIAGTILILFAGLILFNRRRMDAK